MIKNKCPSTGKTSYDSHAEAKESMLRIKNHNSFAKKNFLNKVKSNCKDGTIVTFFTYYKFDSRLTPVRIVYTNEEFNNLPDSYKKNRYFNNKTYTFWYTKFNGTDFYTDGNIII